MQHHAAGAAFHPVLSSLLFNVHAARAAARTARCKPRAASPLRVTAGKRVNDAQGKRRSTHARGTAARRTHTHVTLQTDRPPSKDARSLWRAQQGARALMGAANSALQGARAQGPGVPTGHCLGVPTPGSSPDHQNTPWPIRGQRKRWASGKKRRARAPAPTGNVQGGEPR